MLDLNDYTDKYVNEEELIEVFERENGREPYNDELQELIESEYDGYMSDKEDYDYEMEVDRRLFSKD